MASASFITCVSDVKTSSSSSTYPSTVKSIIGDSDLSWKSSSSASSNSKGSSTGVVYGLRTYAGFLETKNLTKFLVKHNPSNILMFVGDLPPSILMI